MGIEVQDKKRNGRQKRRWLDTVRVNLRDEGL